MGYFNEERVLQRKFIKSTDSSILFSFYFEFYAFFALKTFLNCVLPWVSTIFILFGEAFHMFGNVHLFREFLGFSPKRFSLFLWSKEEEDGENRTISNLKGGDEKLGINIQNLCAVVFGWVACIVGLAGMGYGDGATWMFCMGSSLAVFGAYFIFVHVCVNVKFV